jgi:hypothetical protein
VLGAASLLAELLLAGLLLLLLSCEAGGSLGLLLALHNLLTGKSKVKSKNQKQNSNTQNSRILKLNKW